MRTLLYAWFMVGCGRRAAPTSAVEAPEFDVVLVPGCPSKPDGRLSGCQWQRAIWAARVWEDGRTRAFITTGGAVHNRYVESEAIRAGMVALGVPGERIHLETQALHTDENAGYGARIATSLGYRRIGVASHGGQARGMRAMLRGWGFEADVAPMELGEVIQRIHEGLPDTRTEPVSHWLPVRERERQIARERGRARRPPSWWVYSLGALGMRRRGPPEPPRPEPTLSQ